LLLVFPGLSLQRIQGSTGGEKAGLEGRGEYRKGWDGRGIGEKWMMERDTGGWNGKGCIWIVMGWDEKGWVEEVYD
jgi:hypothetical protein